jgi:putative modified peptide
MAMGKKGPKMDPHVVKKLLDGLTKDEAFRKKFQEDPGAALASIGYVVPAGETSAAGCLTLAAGETLATADAIEAQRTKLEASMVGIFGFDCPAALKG